jgi:predicted DNA binding CopG/RHH family protein
MICQGDRFRFRKFKSETDEADWWASAAGRNHVKRKSKAAQAKGIKPVGSRLVADLVRKRTKQIAIRLPESDIEQARKIADSKGIGYQTLLKMLVRQGQQREARRI